MSARVRIPTVLRPATGGLAEITAPGVTVGEVLRSVTSDHPRLSGVVFDGAGGLKHYLAVFLGDQDVRTLQGLDTPVAEGAEIIVIPAASGGAR